MAQAQADARRTHKAELHTLQTMLGKPMTGVNFGMFTLILTILNTDDRTPLF